MWMRPAFVRLQKYSFKRRVFGAAWPQPLLEPWRAKNITELDWWQKAQRKGVTIQANTAALVKENTIRQKQNSLVGWMLQWNDFSFYFAEIQVIQMISKKLQGDLVALI